MTRNLWEYIKTQLLAFRSLIKAVRSVMAYLFYPDELHKEITELYPDPVSSKTADDYPARSRGMPVNQIERCTGCGDCEKICPTSCIVIKSEPLGDSNKRWVSVFEIDYGSCVFCGLCVRVCAPGSLTHSKEHERPRTALSFLRTEFGSGEISNALREKWSERRANAAIEEESWKL